MKKYRKQLRWATIVAFLIMPVYQQYYWWTHGCVNSRNCVISIVWFLLCAAIAVTIANILFPQKKSDNQNI